MTSTEWAIHLLRRNGNNRPMSSSGQRDEESERSGEWPERRLQNHGRLIFFSWSVVRGFTAGVLAGLALKPDATDSQPLMDILAEGYAGTDFIDAFMKKSFPDIQKAAMAAQAAGGAEKLPVVKALGAPAVVVIDAARA
ncbi:hypothetical protein [Bradyrhizobium sp. BR 10289]|uniref:hypothetical protein n=1 Tax=Bradyrhizobium sp. BR 10289 TaxID=2749993 RepID=UPI001C646B82|nr:hypothetical protein [Bradyrhizobium sp. BR 10289]MBW7967962.1 hypothetical protein [Bradyrhizobium sp. BR 10289]